MRYVIILRRRLASNRLALDCKAGFTLVELMIATLVFSVILLVITDGVIYFTTDYYKGVNSSTTQNVAANVMNTIAQSIQFSNISKTIPAAASTGDGHGNMYLCVANKEFVLQPGVQDSTNVGLYMFDDSGTCVADYASSAGWSKHQDLLQPHMRLVNLAIDGPNANNTFNVAITVAYGDDDLLCIPGVPNGHCNDNGMLAAFTNPNITCKARSGTQFCSVSSLSTTVNVRL